MAEPTAYQYAKLGSNLEFLRGISSVSLMQTTSLVAFPHLLGNLPAQRYSVPRVVEVLKSLLIQLEEMELKTSLQIAEHYRPMLQDMEEYLDKNPNPQTAFLLDHFADRLVEIAKHLAIALKQDLGTSSASS
jgi:hypothetical protein